MTSRRPLVTANGQTQQLPAGDTISSDAIPAHVHAADDISSGILAVARGGTGVAAQPYFWLGRSASQWPVSNLTFTIVPWDLLVAQSVTVWANGHIYPTAGNWHFTVSITWNAFIPTANQYLQIGVYRNNAYWFSPPAVYPPAANGYYGASFSFYGQFNGADWLDIYVRQNSGATRYGYGDASYMVTSWQGARLGA
jgi:hypothetical protein